MNRLKVFILSGLAAWYARLLAWTCPMRIIGENHLERALAGGERVIGVFWHGRLTAPLLYHMHRQIPVLVSEHEDGEVIARALHRLGYRTVRGSSSHGGKEALVELMVYLRDEGPVVGVTPDGPTGPARQCKAGIIRLAQKTGAVIIPLASTCDHPRYLRTWDRFLMIRPFQPCYLAFGAPMRIAETETPDAFERERARVDAALQQLENLIDRWAVEASGPEWRMRHAGPLPERPRWFWRPAGALLASWYGLLSRRRFRRLQPRRLPCRVISVGNLSVGGTGKTPMTHWIAERLAGAGRRPVVLSRGYRRIARTLRIVQPGNAMSVQDVGDEPFLTASRGIPLVVYRDRYEAGLAAVEKLGAEICILDDGFQHRQVARDCDIVLIDGERGWGNSRLLPAGWLRESPEALQRAHAVVVTRTCNPALELQIRRYTGAPLFHAVARVTHLLDRDGRVLADTPLSGGAAVLAAGIGHFMQFRETVESTGVRVTASRYFPDHHRYSYKDGRQIEALFRGHECNWVLTTEKDLPKIAVVVDPLIPLLAVRIAFDVTGDLKALDQLMAGK